MHPAPQPTERLAFRRWSVDDVPTALDIYSRPEVSRFLGAAPRPVEDLEEARRRIAVWDERTTGLGGIWALERRDAPGMPIGSMLLVPLPRSDGEASDAWEIGWHLHPDHWGQGYATEGAVPLIERARAAGLGEVRAVVHAGNAASRAVCRRLGMVDVGSTTRWYGVELVEYLLDLAAPDAPEVLAVRIAQARAEGRLLPAPAAHGLSAGDAYRVQARVLATRLERGGGRGGWKLGYTSQAMREQMGVAEANFGPLSTAMLLKNGAVIGEGVAQPRVEPELAAVIAEDIAPDADESQIAASVAEWRLALEVVDSVWEGYRFDWALNTADGSSAGFVVLGDVVDPGDLATIDVTFSRNGEPVGRGVGAAAMGDPAAALAWLVGRLAESGEALRAGEVVITGGLTAAVPLAPGDRIEARAAGRAVWLMRRGSDASAPKAT